MLKLRIEPLEPRCLLSGMTLITHGFGGSVEGWVSEMADAVFARAAADSVEYVVEVTDPGHDDGPLEVRNISRSGPSLQAAGTQFPEMVILLDWSDVAGSFFPGAHIRSTVDVAAAVAQALVAPGFLTGLAAPAVELPIHLIGHSRGGSLVGDLARRLGELGVWVDHVTTLDPHPVDGIRDPFGFDFGDAPMSASENITFWDNYWRTDGATSLDFTGEAVAGTHNVQLQESVLDNFTGYSNEHSDTHLWYHGTIDTTGPIDDGSASVSENAGWYAGAMGPRDGIGYNFGRIVGLPRPAGGIAQALGGQANRTAIASHSNDRWPNLLELQQLSDAQLEVGDEMLLDYFWRDFDSESTLTLFLDTDRNPYNGTGQQVGEPRQLPTTNAGSIGRESLQVDTSGVASGHYELLARVSDSARTRFVYSEPLELSEPVNESLRVTSLLPTTTGFIVEFNRPLDSSVLNLYGVGEPDVGLAGQNQGSVAGSVTVDPSAARISFVKTSGLLEADTYTIVLRSAADSFQDLAGELLDGDLDGIAGGDYTASFTAAPSSGRIVSIPNFVRGPGQAVHLPADAFGIPIELSDGEGVESVEISIQYSSESLDITAAAVASGSPEGSSASLDSSVPGLAVVTYQAPGGLPAGSKTIVVLQASVPSDNNATPQPIGRLLDLSVLSVRDTSGNLLPSDGDDALHLPAYFADVTGNGRINAGDAAQLARVAALIDRGFAFSVLVDPLLVGDITGNGRLNAADASRIAQFAALIPVPEIPPIPPAPQTTKAKLVGDRPSSKRLEDGCQDRDRHSLGWSYSGDLAGSAPVFSTACCASSFSTIRGSFEDEREIRGRASARQSQQNESAGSQEGQHSKSNCFEIPTGEFKRFNSTRFRFSSRQVS